MPVCSYATAGRLRGCRMADSFAWRCGSVATMPASSGRSDRSWRSSPMFADLESVLGQITPLDAAWIQRAETRQASLTKPPGSLGRLEEVANRMAAIQRTLMPSAERARIVVFAADHGVTAEGV